METVKQSKSVYALVTERIINQLEKGIVPWKKTWSEAGEPQNLITGQRYRGVNVLLLTTLNYPENLFLTYRQALFYGGHVREGEKGHLVVYTKFIEEKKENDKPLMRQFMLRYYTVFNVTQCSGIPEKHFPKKAPEKKPLEICERIIQRMPDLPDIRFEKDYPFYNPKDDYINMPPIDRFEGSINYYETLFHELAHSTGHSKRLARPEVMDNKSFGTEMYSKEELTAEITACMLKSFAGIKESVSENNVAYIQSWLKALRNDSRFIVFASAQAQRAVDYILNMNPSDDDSPSTLLG